MTDFEYIKKMLTRQCNIRSGGSVEVTLYTVTTRRRWVNGKMVHAETEETLSRITYVGHGMDMHATIFRFDKDGNFVGVGQGGIRY